MSIQQNAPNLSILTTVAVTRARLVSALGALCVVAAARNHIGVTQEDQATVGLPVTVRMPHAGTVRIEAAVAIAAGAAVYYDTLGRIGTTSASNTQVGIAMEAASGAGSIIEVMPF